MYKEEIEQLKIKFGKKLNFLRNSKDLTQEQLSLLIAVHREHIAKVETARRNLSFDKLFLLSIKLNIPLKEFFDF